MLFRSLISHSNLILRAQPRPRQPSTVHRVVRCTFCPQRQSMVDKEGFVGDVARNKGPQSRQHTCAKLSWIIMAGRGWYLRSCLSHPKISLLYKVKMQDVCNYGQYKRLIQSSVTTCKLYLHAPGTIYSQRTQLGSTTMTHSCTMDQLAGLPLLKCMVTVDDMLISHSCKSTNRGTTRRTITTNT